MRLWLITTKKKFLVIGLVLLIVSGWYLTSRQAKNQPPQLAAVHRQTIKSTVSTSGELAGKNTTNLKFKSGGKLAYLNVKVGDQVNVGSTIAGLDTQDLKITLQQALNTYNAKQATAQNIEDSVKDHTTNETYTQRDTRTTAQVARDNAYDAIKAAERAFQDAVIVAPIGGTVTQASFLAGQNIAGSDTIAQVVDWSEVFFDAEVDESDIGKVSVGQKAEVNLNAYSDKTFYGTVNQILPQTKTTSSGATVVTVRVKLNAPKINLIPALKGQVNIITDQRDNVLSIPYEALKEDGSVITQEGGVLKSVKIQTGLKSDTLTEVVSGLQENEQVVTNPTEVSLTSNQNNPLNQFTRFFRNRR